jgi:hypothetical protein
VEARLRFADVRVGVRFTGRPVAEALLPALSHRLDPGPGPVDATITVRRHDRENLAWWERAAPLRLPLLRALGGDRRRVVHAAAVGDERGCALLVGARLAGKTTVATAALRSGFGFVADDYLLLQAGSPFEAVALYGTVCIRAQARDVVKDVLYVEALMPGALRDSLPVRAVVMPRIVGGGTRWRPVRAAAALRAWAPTTAFLMPTDRGAAVPLLSELVQAVPCFALDVGDSSVEIAGAVDELLDRALSPP